MGTRAVGEAQGTVPTAEGPVGTPGWEPRTTLAVGTVGQFPPAAQSRPASGP